MNCSEMYFEQRTQCRFAVIKQRSLIQIIATLIVRRWFVSLSSHLLNFKKRCAALNNLKVRLAARLWRTRFSRRLWTLPKQKSGLRARLYCPGTSSKGGVHGVEHFAQQRIDQENAFI